MGKKPSLFFIIILAIAALPAILFPTFLMMSEELPYIIDRFILYGFPVYLIVSALLAWLCYPLRTTMAWILVIVMVLSDLAMTTLLFLLN